MPDEQDFLVPKEPHMYIAIDLKSFFASDFDLLKDSLISLRML